MNGCVIMKNRIVKSVFTMVAAFVLLFAFSCSNNSSIVGYYTPEKINTVIYFAPDGKIYENYSSESVSCYKVNGNKISMFVEGEEDIKMEFELTRTESGIKIGDAVYTRIDEPEYNVDADGIDEDQGDGDGGKVENAENETDF